MTVFALEDILFPDGAPAQISAKIDDGLVAVADAFAVNNPLFWTIPGHRQAFVHDGLQELCSEDFRQGFVTEEIVGRFHPPQSCFHVDACPGHDDMNVRVIVEGS